MRFNTKEAVAQLKRLAIKGNIVAVFDMDGVCVEFIDNETVNPDWSKKMLLPGYYRSLPPIEEGVHFLKETIQALGADSVYICTKGPTEISYQEKKEWIQEHVPEMKQENILPVGMHESKAPALHNLLESRGIDPTVAILIDDYGRNLKEWYDEWISKGGSDMIPHPTLKVANGYNFKGPRNQLCPVVFLRSPEKAAQAWAAATATEKV